MNPFNENYRGGWGIIEVETGLIDGWYKDFHEAMCQMEQYYFVEFPDYSYFIIHVDVSCASAYSLKEKTLGQVAGQRLYNKYLK